MLQQFTPLYKHQAQTSQILETPKVTVQFPLLYRVMKDNRAHYILGHVHPIPLEFMPEYVIQIMNNSDCLLTEGLATLPQELQANMIKNTPFYDNYTSFFSNTLKKEAKERFGKDLIEIIQIITNLNCQNLKVENLASILLSTLFNMCIENRVIPEKLRIDEALIQHFKIQGKAIIELNKQIKKEYVSFCIKNEEHLQKQLYSSEPEHFSATASLHVLATKINEHYENLDKHDLMKDDIIKKFLEHDLVNDQITYNDETTEAVEAIIQTQNKIWLHLFINEHNKGTNNMFLACGYRHLLLPQQGFLHLLTQQGFTVERVYETQLHHQPSKHTVTC